MTTIQQKLTVHFQNDLYDRAALHKLIKWLTNDEKVSPSLLPNSLSVVLWEKDQRLSQKGHNLGQHAQQFLQSLVGKNVWALQIGLHLTPMDTWQEQTRVRLIKQKRRRRLRRIDNQIVKLAQRRSSNEMYKNFK